METFLQGLIMAFREGLEAFLIVVILLKFLERTDNKQLKSSVWYGLLTAMGISIAFGLILAGISYFIGGIGVTAKIWESIASILAVGLLLTFIRWMINHSSEIKHHIEKKATLNLSKKGIFLLVLFMVIREGVEIVLFQFAGKYEPLSIVVGLLISIALVVLIYFSIVKVNLGTIFKITLAYLILQAGFLAGYGIHEGLSAAKELEYISSDSFVYEKAFDLSDTVLNHKEGILGVPLYALFGWYSKPEWIQLLVHYGVVCWLFWYWVRKDSD